jgi:hypothetical protein
MKSSKVRVVLILAILTLTAALPAQAGKLFGFLHGNYVNGSGDLITEARDVGSFTELEVSGSFDVFVTCGEEQKIEITIDDNLMDLITTDIRRGRLVIKCEESISAHRRRSKIEISVPELTAVALSGSGDVTVNGMKGGEVELTVSGSGMIKAREVKAESLTATISGSGELEAAGKTGDLSVRVSGSGDVDLSDLIADDADVRISGSGDVELYAEGSFSGSVTGSGDIRIHGNPKMYKQKVNGSGDIRRI